MPAAASDAMWCSINGRPATGSSGLGVRSVSGRMRSPRPAARIIARMASVRLQPRQHRALHQLLQRRQLRVRSRGLDDVAQGARHVAEIAALPVAMPEPGEDTAGLEVALDANTVELVTLWTIGLSA